MLRFDAKFTARLCIQEFDAENKDTRCITHHNQFINAHGIEFPIAVARQIMDRVTIETRQPEDIEYDVDICLMPRLW